MQLGGCYKISVGNFTKFTNDHLFNVDNYKFSNYYIFLV